MAETLMKPKPPDILTAFNSYIFIQLAWEGKVFGDKTSPPFRRINYYPSDEYPLGRKGYLLERIWRYAAREQTAGICILDGDVVIDPLDMQTMWQSMASDNTSVHIGPARIYPISTQMPQWVWGHRNTKKPDTWQNIDPPKPIDTFSFCFTYLPRALLEICISSGLKDLVYPEVDKTVSHLAFKNKIPVHVVQNCQPKHMNY